MLTRLINAQIVITDNSYRSYECFVKTDVLILTKKNATDTVTTCLLKADSFSISEEHFTKSMQNKSLGFIEIQIKLYAIITLDHKIVTDPIISNVLG